MNTLNSHRGLDSNTLPLCLSPVRVLPHVFSGSFPSPPDCFSPSRGVLCRLGLLLGLSAHQTPVPFFSPTLVHVSLSVLECPITSLVQNKLISHSSSEKRNLPRRHYNLRLTFQSGAKGEKKTQKKNGGSNVKPRM